jgi:serine protease AprX
MQWVRKSTVAGLAGVLLAALCGPVALAAAATPDGPELDVIVQARPGQVKAAEAAVAAAGGSVVAELPLVDGFRAQLQASAAAEVSADPSVRAITSNDNVHFENVTYDATTTASNFAKTSGATTAWTRGLRGDGVGVAVIDTGISNMNDVRGRIVYGPDLSGEGTTVDSFGHGTVMGGIIGGSGSDSASNTNGAYTGVAPGATLISVKAAGRNGAADVSTMLQAMHWVAAYKDQYNIRVLNLSWGTASKQDPAVDPINYAVERLWRLGIVVVVAAGNSGPNSGTITKPGDDPLVITAGAFDDKQNLDPSDDSIPSWSSRGPTPTGLTKPDLVSPGRTLIATRSFGSAVETDNPKSLISPSYIKGSGTSQAAAVTSGLVALLLQARPTLTPDQVKGILKGTASPLASALASAQGSGRVQLSAALDAAAPTTTQTFAGSGMGSLEASRGGRNVQTDCGNNGTIDLIQGEIDVYCQPWDPGPWTGGAWTGGAWTGGAWTGGAWTEATWTGGAWTGGAWTGGAWTGGAWTGGAWTGGAWTGGAWTGGAWTGASWAGGAWTGGAWTTAEYEEFLTAFWGPQPKACHFVAGEHNTCEPRNVR